MNPDTKFILDELASVKAKTELSQKILLELLPFLVEKSVLTKQEVEELSQRFSK